MEKLKVYAKSKYIQMSPRKVRLVADMVRGKDATYAAEALQFVNKAAALPVRKTIESAIANAENNFDLDKKELKIVEARVDEAPTFKRGRAVSKGRYHQILKRNSHIVIAVSDGKTEVGAKKTKAKKAESKTKNVKKVKPSDEKKKPEKQIKKEESKPKQDLSKKGQVRQTGTQRRVQKKG